MPNHPEDDAEWLARQLRDLPDVPAPPTLIPRVMAAVRAREAGAKAWWQRTWWEWPRPAQAASLVLLSVAIGLLGLLSVEIREAVASSYWQNALLEGQAEAAPLLRAWHALGSAVGALLSYVTRPTLLILGGVYLSLYLLCVGLGTLLYRLICAARSGC
jgi:hypothetical protein